MKNLRALVVLSICSSLTHHEMVSGAPYTYECDVPEGRYSKVEIPLKAGSVHVSGEIVVNEIRASDIWAPGINVILHDNTPSTAAGLRAEVLERDLGKINFHPYGNEAATKEMLASLEWKDAVISFNVAAESPGEVRVGLGERSYVVEIESKGVSYLTLGCSSGDFSFRAIQVR